MIEEKSPKRSNLLRLPPEILGVIGELVCSSSFQLLVWFTGGCLLLDIWSGDSSKSARLGR